MDEVLDRIIEIRAALKFAPRPARLVLAMVLRELADEIEQPRVMWFRWDDTKKALVSRGGNEEAAGSAIPGGR